MLLLIYRASIPALLLGWDGLGITSYLLVVYYMRFSRSIAGYLTFIMNRVGDIFFIVTVCLIYFIGAWSIRVRYSVLVSFFMILTAMTKRAQLPFSSWLPAAIAAPTPVSSLVHSSTLVTAGIYLLLRFEGCVLKIRSILILISLCTILMAGLSAIREWDIKKIIAYSTLSQLGFIIFSLRQGLVFFLLFSSSLSCFI